MATLRQQITALLEARSLTALDISGAVGIAEKEVVRHLTHIERSAARSGRRLVVSPSTCRACGFTFTARRRLTRPGRCPRCRATRIDRPVFHIAP